GFIICSLLCANWWGERTCFYEGRLGFCSGLNFVAVIINIVMFVINFLSISALQLEKLYSAVAFVLFLIASALMIWIIILNDYGWNFFCATALMVCECILFLRDYQILHYFA
ncbi:hypothetical protein PMAYCL1PPCAC_09289, partial [Pristionchus mayeri]